MLAGIAQLTCASMRCKYHEPPETEEDPDPESTEPLVPTTLTEFEVPFSYSEDGEQKSALVKVVLCRGCGKKLLHGREEGKKKERERGEGTVGRRDDVERSGRHRNADRRNESDDDEEFAPSLPPDMEEVRHRSRRRSSPPRDSSRRRSASPRRR